MNNPPFFNFISEDPLFLVGICVTLACLLLGFAIGRLTAKLRTSKEVKDAFEEGRKNSQEESQREKAEISSELEHELLKVRESIIQSAKAYENTVKIVQEKLQPKDASNLSALNGSSEAQLALDFNTSGPTSDSPTSDAETSKTSELENFDDQDTQLDFKIPEVRTNSLRQSELKPESDKDESSERKTVNSN